MYKNINCLKNKLHHVAIIMDGNRRWAKLKNKKIIFGYKQGIKAVKKSIKFAIDYNINILTLYTFSSENWKRSKKEISDLMKLFIDIFDTEIHNLKLFKIKLQFIGDIKNLDTKLKYKILNHKQYYLKNEKLILNIAINYGGRWDIIQGVKKIAKKIQNKKIHYKDINENYFNKLINMSDLKPVDLVIRTGGEKRLSNFLLWQIAYSELYFTDVLWPDFNEKLFEIAIKEFENRERRFGSKIENIK